MRAFDLAQLNVGRLVAAEDSPVVAEFIEALDEINALAEAWPGFVWRFQTDDGNAIAERPFPDDALMLVNFSTWESLEALADYVFRSRHADFLRRRREWFQHLEETVTVLWWVPVGHRPTSAEAVARLDHLRRHGPTSHAFTFRGRFEPDGGEAVPSDLLPLGPPVDDPAHPADGTFDAAGIDDVDGDRDTDAVLDQSL